jgi:hypothetical protein
MGGEFVLFRHLLHWQSYSGMVFLHRDQTEGVFHMKTTALVSISLILLATLSFAAGLVMEPVQTALIVQAGYDPDTQLMAVTMGEPANTYFFKAVPADVYNAFKTTESKDSYFLENITGKSEDDMAR